MPYKDPEEGRAKRREHYRQNKEAYLERSKKYRANHREMLRSYVRSIKEDTPCGRCGHRFPYVVMDFHHRDADDKDTTICQMCHKGVPLERVKAEIEKCDLFCANCHRLEHLGWRLDTEEI